MALIEDGYVSGLGPETLVPKVRSTALAGLKLGPEEGFVLSRIDGHTTVAQLLLLVPFDAEVTVLILQQLIKHGAVDVPGADIPVALPMLAPEAGPPTAGPSLIDGLELTVEQARRIDEFYASLHTRDAFELLEVVRGADKKDIKRAYFKMSKELHPDRFFGKNIGPYRERLSKIFQSIKAAYELLSDDARRAAYLDSVK
ncbi:MAG: J domain-containing protein [Myxococcales bacterium]|nr:J domain-containing protein [Myxococcales bacterium]